ncbi:lipopolysaccharide biosynthesis protein [Nostoc sp. UHCC 0870]|uniref:lipopolysaccharide biosynthesis protein n=1 Tax=Nostoc sp. UHCC 0870 TaxID=2914041 RepID=UPI001EDE2C3E|nr:oligosaccharide flippase family protein [Nostoc sp. UHCC 0870]UKO98443.1 oligosaccharide flippase family protein [Nostoc sp. UHCC 0870]
MKQLLLNKRIKSAFFLSIISYLALGIGFITQAFAARILGVQDYGIVSLALAYPSILFSITSPKSVSVLTRYIAKYRAENKRNLILITCLLGYTLDLVTSLIAVIIILLTSQYISANFYRTIEVTSLTNIYSLSLPLLAITSTSTAIINGYEKYSSLGWFQLLEKLSMPLCFLFILPIIKSNSLSFICAYAAANYFYGLICLVFTIYILYKNGLLKNIVSVVTQLSFKNELRKLAYELASSYTWNFILVTITGFISQLPVIILGSLGTPKDAGFYKLGSMIAVAASYPKVAMGRILLPKLSVEASNLTWIQMLQNLKRWTLNLGIPISLIILILSMLIYPAIKTFYGSQYISSILGIQILIVASAFLTTFFWLEPFYYAYAKYKLFTNLHFAYFFVFCSSSFILTLAFGFTGMCFADLLSKLFLISLLLGYSRKCLVN